MSRVAVDIVLLPDDVATDLCVNINSELIKTNSPEQILHKENCLPHISLLMGVIEEDKIFEIENILKDIIKNYSILNLSVEKLSVDIRPNGEKGTTCFDLFKTNELKQLHKEIVDKCSKLMKYDATPANFFNPDEVLEINTYWVNNFLKSSIYEKYNPHISLGKGDVEVKLPINFTSKRLAICHLGNFCTCRKVLYEVELM